MDRQGNKSLIKRVLCPPLADRQGNESSTKKWSCVRLWRIDRATKAQYKNGLVAEWLGRALQKLLQRFESARDLLKPPILWRFFYLLQSLICQNIYKISISYFIKSLNFSISSIFRFQTPKKIVHSSKRITY